MAQKSQEASGIERDSTTSYSKKAGIDFGFSEALTTYGIIGIKGVDL